jgi:hypothetical protein
MIMTAIRTAVLWHPVFLLSLTQAKLSSLSAEVETPEAAHFRVAHERNIVLYKGPLVHDQEWVITHGTTNNRVLGVFGGTCSLTPSNVRNIRGFEQVPLEIEDEGLGVWKTTHVDTVVGIAAADTGQQYRYTYNLRRSARGITTDGKPPRPNRAMPTPSAPGFLEPVPSNVESAALTFEDLFMLIEESTGRLVADANVLGPFHRQINPSEQPPAFFPFVLDGYIATSLQTIAGQSGCDPL